MTVTIAAIPHFPNSYYNDSAFWQMVTKYKVFSWEVAPSSDPMYLGNPFFRDNEIRGEHPYKIICPTSRESFGTSNMPNFLLIRDRICRIVNIGYVNTVSCSIEYWPADDYNDLHVLKQIPLIATASFSTDNGNPDLVQPNSTTLSNCEKLALARGATSWAERVRSFNPFGGTGASWIAWAKPGLASMFTSFPSRYDSGNDCVIAAAVTSNWGDMQTYLNGLSSTVSEAIIGVTYWPAPTSGNISATFNVKQSGMTLSIVKSMKLWVDVAGNSKAELPYIGDASSMSETANISMTYSTYATTTGIKVQLRGGWAIGPIPVGQGPVIGVWDIKTLTPFGSVDALRTLINFAGVAATSIAAVAAIPETAGASAVALANVGATAAMAAPIMNPVKMSYGAPTAGTINYLSGTQTIAVTDSSVDSKVGSNITVNITAQYPSGEAQAGQMAHDAIVGVDHQPYSTVLDTTAISNYVAVKGLAAVNSSELRNQFTNGLRIFGQDMSAVTTNNLAFYWAPAFVGSGS